MFPEVDVDDIRNNAVSGGNSGGSFSTTTVPNVTQSYTQIAPSVSSCASFGGCEEIVQSLNNSLNNCNLNLEDCTTQYIELAEQYNIVVDENGELIDEIADLQALLDGTAAGCASSSDSISIGTMNWTWCASIDESTNKIVGVISWGSVGVPAPSCGGGSAFNYLFRVKFYTEANAYIGEAGRFSNGSISQAIYPCNGGPFTNDGIKTGVSSMVLNQVVPANAYFVGMENSRIRIKPSPFGPQISP